MPYSRRWNKVENRRQAFGKGMFSGYNAEEFSYSRSNPWTFLYRHEYAGTSISTAGLGARKGSHARSGGSRRSSWSFGSGAQEGSPSSPPSSLKSTNVTRRSRRRYRFSPRQPLPP